MGTAVIENATPNAKATHEWVRPNTMNPAPRPRQRKQLAAELGEAKEANGRAGASQCQHENFIEVHFRNIGRLPPYPQAVPDERSGNIPGLHDPQE
jgi:hypothetical protein